MTGTNNRTSHAPPNCPRGWNFTMAMMTATTAVQIAPKPLIARPSRHPGSLIRRWRLAIPLWESVKDVNTPSAYSGIMAVTLALNTTMTSEAAKASARIPFEKTSLCPRLVSCRGMNASPAWKLARRGKSAKDVLAARIRMAVVETCRTRNRACPIAPFP